MRTRLVVAALVVAGCGEPARPSAAGPAETPAQARAAANCAAAALASGRECPVRAGGEPRRYVLHAPAGTEPVPLIVALHGVGGPAANPRATAEASGLHELPGVAVAYADGNGTWEARRDDAYFAALLDDVPRRRAIDPARVYVVGWSGGGFMAHRVACRLAGRIAAVAVLHAPLRGPCAPERPVSVLQIVGARDPFIPVAGGETPDGTPSPPARAATRRWRQLNRCERATATERDGVRELTAHCAAGTTVTLREIDDGEHTWFADATTTMWGFFTAPRAH